MKFGKEVKTIMVVNNQFKNGAILQNAFATKFSLLLAVLAQRDQINLAGVQLC